MGQYVRHLNQFHCRIILCWTLATSRSPGFGLIRPRKYCTGIAKLSCIISFGARKSSAGMVQLSVARTYVHLVPENLVPGCLQGQQLHVFTYLRRRFCAGQFGAGFREVDVPLYPGIPGRQGQTWMVLD
jgi:hypothetical protein